MPSAVSRVAIKSFASRVVLRSRSANAREPLQQYEATSVSLYDAGETRRMSQGYTSQSANIAPSGSFMTSVDSHRGYPHHGGLYIAHPHRARHRPKPLLSCEDSLRGSSSGPRDTRCAATRRERGIETLTFCQKSRPKVTRCRLVIELDIRRAVAMPRRPRDIPRLLAS
ncbi:hypothetical protein DENSPDRAFT_832560 [Dentipellis sp. KUC8613]|nr:hypothetical protein DENSPDRAFT_832560 [Dentipellis sp. KUC8613]